MWPAGLHPPCLFLNLWLLVVVVPSIIIVTSLNFKYSAYLNFPKYKCFRDSFEENFMFVSFRYVVKCIKCKPYFHISSLLIRELSLKPKNSNILSSFDLKYSPEVRIRESDILIVPFHSQL